MADETEEPRDKAWASLKSEISFQGSLGREKLTELFGFIDEMRAENKRLRQDLSRAKTTLEQEQETIKMDVAKNTADLTYIRTAFDGDRFLGPGIFERLDRTQKSIDEQQKSIEQITRKVDESAVISQQNQILSKQLSVQLKLLILVFVLFFVLLLFYVVATYL